MTTSRSTALLESWASLKSFQRKPNLGGQRSPKRGRRGGGPPGATSGGRNQEVNFRGELSRTEGQPPRVAQNQNGRRSAIDDRTAGQLGYLVSQRMRRRVEEIFGWWKAVSSGRKLRYIGIQRNQLWAEPTSAAYNKPGLDGQSMTGPRLRPQTRPYKATVGGENRRFGLSRVVGPSASPVTVINRAWIGSSTPC
ncbi:MAG: hypothetical protein ACYDAL_11850 [Candidatus Dormibacteraceae bacterium]